MKRRPSLLQQNALRLLVVFLVFEVAVAAAVMTFLMLPMARRAAGDFAELLAISAKTWAELPPETRPAFERELAQEHRIVLRLDAPASGLVADVHGPYVDEIEAALAEHFSVPVTLLDESRGGDGWHWARMEAGGRTLWLGFPHSRVGTHPAVTVAITLGVGVVLAVLTAWWLARRIVAPLERLDRAAALLGRGGTPERLPERGPRELAALAERVNALVSQVHDLLEARTTLLAGLSHDLRTPLTRMRLALELLSRRPEPALIARLEQDIEEMNRLVGDMLGLARGLGGELPQPVDVRALLDDLALQARQAGSRVDVVGPAAEVLAPPLALRRAVSNLLTNAQRYAGDVAIELRCEHAQGQVGIGVLDQGPGIPEEQLQAVFRPFHRVEPSRSPHTGGAGLGLAIVQQLAQSNGWQVRLANRATGGLEAWLMLPERTSDRATESLRQRP